jgi:hypothetical protein
MSNGVITAYPFVPFIENNVNNFSPLQIGGLITWLDASDTATLYTTTGMSTAATADGDKVGRWLDKSGNGFDAQQSTLLNRPTLKLATMAGHRCVDFTGSPVAMGCSAMVKTLSEWTMIFAVQPYADYGDYRMFANLGYDGVLAENNDQNAAILVTELTTGNIYTQHKLNTAGPVAYSDTNPQVLGWQWIGSGSNNLKIYKNTGAAIAQATDAATGTMAINGYSLGANYRQNASYMSMRLSEMLLYSRKLTTAELNRARSYLASKWGVSASNANFA